MLGYSRHKYHALLTSQTMTAQGKKLLMFDFDNRFVKKLIVNLFICLVNPNNEASHSYIDIENNYILKDTKLLLKKKKDTKYFYFFMERAMKPAGCL
jgi:hypothetical protein